MELLSDFIKLVETTRTKLSTVKTRQLQSPEKREDIKKIVPEYYDKVRPSFISDEAVEPTIAAVDNEMQALLVLCHKRGNTAKYKSMLSSIRRNLIAIDAQLLATPKISDSPNVLNSIDQQIIDTLDKIVPSAAQSYKQAMLDLQLPSRHSWRGPATDIRESLRETLDHFAPDAGVVKMPGYKQEVDTKGPTMKQKIKYILSKREISKGQSNSAINAVTSIEDIVGTYFRSVYQQSSVSSHTATRKDDVIRIRTYARASFCELLEIKN